MRWHPALQQAALCRSLPLNVSFPYANSVCTTPTVKLVALHTFTHAPLCARGALTPCKPGELVYGRMLVGPLSGKRMMYPISTYDYNCNMQLSSNVNAVPKGPIVCGLATATARGFAAGVVRTHRIAAWCFYPLLFGCKRSHK